MAEVININEKRKDENIVASKEWQDGYSIGLDAWEAMDKAMQESDTDAHDQVKQIAGLVQSIMNGLYYMAPEKELAQKIVEISARQAEIHLDAHKEDWFFYGNH